MTNHLRYIQSSLFKKLQIKSYMLSQFRIVHSMILSFRHKRYLLYKHNISLLKKQKISNIVMNSHKKSLLMSRQKRSKFKMNLLCLWSVESGTCWTVVHVTIKQMIKWNVFIHKRIPERIFQLPSKMYKDKRKTTNKMLHVELVKETVKFAK